jgi:hypothetical protein
VWAGVWLLLYACLEATPRAVHVPARPEGRRTCPVPVLAVLVARGSTRRGALVRASVLSPWRASHDVMLTACRRRAAACVRQRGGQVEKSERKEKVVGTRQSVSTAWRGVLCAAAWTPNVFRAKLAATFRPRLGRRASGGGRARASAPDQAPPVHHRHRIGIHLIHTPHTFTTQPTATPRCSPAPHCAQNSVSAAATSPPQRTLCSPAPPHTRYLQTPAPR